ncbi:MAG: HAMP domain-containing protein [Ignavibacteriae bacterium]|nr:HAMP domain-containing protein [Ignavibacteriota bacterium]
MEKKHSINNGGSKFFDRRLKILTLIAFLIFVWIIVIQLLTGYIQSNINSNWKDIESEKISEQSGIASGLFNDYQFKLNELSENFTQNTSLLKYVQRSDSKRLFEELFKYNLDNNFQVEIYNTRLELLAFKGRKLDSDIYSLQRCVNGKKFSILKEIGFYTYLIIYSPVHDPNDNSQVTGVILTSRLIDIKYQINNKFFQNTGLLNDINEAFDVISELVPADPISEKIDLDSSVLNDNVTIDLKGLEGNIIGVLIIPKYSELTHSQNINLLSKRVISVLIFGLTMILFIIGLKFTGRIESRLLKVSLFSAFMICLRYAWLEFNFPSGIFDSEVFSPGYFASSSGFGIAKSTGELLITSLFILAISIYGIYQASKYSLRNSGIQKNKLSTHAVNLFLIALFFVVIYSFGTVIQSIVFDSNVKFFDKTSIIPNTELFIIQLIILLFSFSMFTIELTIIILIIKNSKFILSPVKILGKYSFLIVLFILLVLNQFITLIIDDFKIEYIYRLMIILFSFFFGVFLARNMLLKKSYNLFSIKNFSLIILFCIIVIPGILLDKITSQETHFVELIGRKIIEKDDDRIKFLLMTELSKFSEDIEVETSIRDKNKFPEMAFSIWADSKFSEENFNTAVIILDTNKKLISDFIFNSGNMNTDSISRYSETNYFKKKDIYDDLKDTSYSEENNEIEEEIDLDISDESDENLSNEEPDIYFTSEKIVILKNEDEKYYLGIVPIERIGLKNTQYETNLGYLLIAVQYESKNFLTHSSMQLFRNYTRDNLFDKLISTPVITEYLGGEIITSTNQDLSKTNTLSLDAFRETVKYKEDKSDWRYEIINNDRYRTFYIVSPQTKSTDTERIFSISLKRNDFKLTTFFYLKFILFTMFLYLIFVSIFSIFIVLRLRDFRFNFREKLFASFFIVSVIPIVLLAIYTRSFIKDKYDYNFQNEIVSDLNLFSQSMTNSQAKYSGLDSLNKDQSNLLTNSLKRSDKNFNLFLRTKLVSTTNDELYRSDLLDTRIDAEAYYNIVYLRKDFFSETEGIGILSFIVGYKPFFDAKNNLVGIMSSQTLYKQNEINEELTEILTFVFGIYIIVIILLLVFVTFLTYRISRPILKLQNATERISKGDMNVKLEPGTKDEIGNLIKSFNNMSMELENSRDKLKKAEREAAWRDIARRVAHEIKNPLTPMKLSIQHLDEVYNNGNGTKDNFPEVLKKTRNIIINEIDKLNNIATEFSDFAKLSGRNYEEVNLNEIIEEVVSLYKLAPDIEFRISLSRGLKNIYADRQELNRVLQNLVKNSIQAIETDGIIDIKTYDYKDVNGEFVMAEITDNGCGIEDSVMDNLFKPNFSTKSTGMGLGLAITKKSLDDMKAEIKFENNISKGTKVILKFKAMKMK